MVIRSLFRLKKFRGWEVVSRISIQERQIRPSLRGAEAGRYIF